MKELTKDLALHLYKVESEPSQLSNIRQRVTGHGVRRTIQSTTTDTTEVRATNQYPTRIWSSDEDNDSREQNIPQQAAPVRTSIIERQRTSRKRTGSDDSGNQSNLTSTTTPSQTNRVNYIYLNFYLCVTK